MLVPGNSAGAWLHRLQLLQAITFDDHSIAYRHQLIATTTRVGYWLHIGIGNSERLNVLYIQEKENLFATHGF